MKFVKEVGLLEKTVDRTNLSTSRGSTEYEDETERMMKKAKTTIRQDTEKVTINSDPPQPLDVNLPLQAICLCIVYFSG